MKQISTITDPKVVRPFLDCLDIPSTEGAKLCLRWVLSYPEVTESQGKPFFDFHTICWTMPSSQRIRTPPTNSMSH